MTKNKKQIQKEYELVHEIYEGLNMRQMEHLLHLMSDRIVIPHWDGEAVQELEVLTSHINGNKIGLITDHFHEHVEEKQEVH